MQKRRWWTVLTHSGLCPGWLRTATGGIHSSIEWDCQLRPLRLKLRRGEDGQSNLFCRDERTRLIIKDYEDSFAWYCDIQPFHFVHKIVSPCSWGLADEWLWRLELAAQSFASRMTRGRPNIECQRTWAVARKMGSTSSWDEGRSLCWLWQYFPCPRTDEAILKALRACGLHRCTLPIHSYYIIESPDSGWITSGNTLVILSAVPPLKCLE